MILYDSNKNKIYVARDPVGVRPLFYGFSSESNEDIYLASEMKAIAKHCDIVFHFPIGSISELSINDTIEYNHKFPIYAYATIPSAHSTFPNIDDYLNELRQFLYKSVIKRIYNRERPAGLFLSGGLDSSLIAAIAQKSSVNKFHSFSIGLEDSTDLFFAQTVAKYIKTEHHEIKYTIQEAIDLIPQIIYTLETFDITTIRASIPMWILSRYISQNTDIRVLLSGEGADEYGSYAYFQDAPSVNEFSEESQRLLNEIHCFDVLRADRVTAAHGLEIRVPFLDREFMNFYIYNLHNRLPVQGVEKYYLRKAFLETNLLPLEILWRKKDAFSDSVGRSWRRALIKHADSLFTDEEFQEKQKKYTHLPPPTKEALWYRQIFDSLFGANKDMVVPRYWMPAWQKDNITDPSATILPSFSGKN